MYVCMYESSRTALECAIYKYIRLKGQWTFPSIFFFFRCKHNSPITNHAKPTLCKERNLKRYDASYWRMSVTRLKFPLGQMWNHANYDLLIRQYTDILKVQSFVACAVEMNLAWNLSGTDRLTLCYDSAEELRRVACFKWSCFQSEQESLQNQVCSLYPGSTLLTRGNSKSDTSL